MDKLKLSEDSGYVTHRIGKEVNEMKWRVRTMFEGDLEYEEVYTTRSWKQAVREHLDDLRVAGEYDTMTIVVEREE